MFPRIIASLFVLFYHLFTYSQNVSIQGTVLNRNDSLPVPYATLGINNKNLGTVASASGVFSFEMTSSEVTPVDSIVVSCIGFYPERISLKDFPNSKVLYLLPKVVEMNEVVVKPSPSCKEVELGKTNHAGLAQMDYYSAREKNFNDKLGRERGALINLDKDKIYNFKTLNVYVAGSQFKSVLFRVCIYKVSEDKIVGENILHNDIRWEIKNLGWNKLDISKYNIILYDTDEIAVTLQWIESQPQNDKSMFFSIKASTTPIKQAVARDKSNSDWSYANGNISVFLTARRCSK